MISGSIVAMVTPFDKIDDAKLDEKTFGELVDLHKRSGTNAIVCCGTTGEAPTLSDDEYTFVLRKAVQLAAGTGMKVIAGTGANNTKEAVRMTAAAAECGVDACMVVSPYYNKPTQTGIAAHFAEINKVGIPFIVYNIPGRTGVNVEPDTLARIFDTCEFALGIKASNGDLDQITETMYGIYSAKKTACLLSGDDSLTLPIVAVGGSGVISVAANIMPCIMAEFMNRCADLTKPAALSTARAMALAMNAFCRALLHGGGSPAQTKAVMQHFGLASSGVRLPLVPIAETHKLRLIEQLRRLLRDVSSLGVKIDTHLEKLVE